MKEVDTSTAEKQTFPWLWGEGGAFSITEYLIRDEARNLHIQKSVRRGEEISKKKTRWGK